MWLPGWLRRLAEARPRPAPWQDDLVGEDTLRSIEGRRGSTRQRVEHAEAELEAALRDDVEAMRRPRKHRRERRGG